MKFNKKPKAPRSARASKLDTYSGPTEAEIIQKTIAEFNIRQMDVIHTYHGPSSDETKKYNSSVMMVTDKNYPRIVLSSWDVRILFEKKDYLLIQGMGDPDFTYTDALNILMSKAEDFTGDSFYTMVPEFATVMADI